VGVAKVEGVDDLDEDTLDQLVVSEEGEPPDDGVETTRTEVIDEEDVTARSISRWKVRNSLMVLCLAGYVVSLLYALDGIASVCSRTCVESTVDDAERTRTQYRLDWILFHIMIVVPTYTQYHFWLLREAILMIQT